MTSALPRAHLVQLDTAWEDHEANMEQVRTLLDDARVARGDFILLGEMFDTGFSFSTEATADVDARTLGFLGELAQEFHATVQGGRTSAPCRRCAARNVMSALGPAEPHATHLAEYAKVHLFPNEAAHLEPGGAIVTYGWEAAGLRVCPAICYDLRFPELFRAGLARGAELYAIGACWPRQRAHHWRALLLARAIENQAFVLGVNRVGKDPAHAPSAGWEYAGGSIAIDPTGEVLGELGDRAGVLSVPIDAARLRAWRDAFPAWRAVPPIPPGDAPTRA
ncbi:MAG: nitrilase-related carbon-nitrogen hydrolase [Planctomycetota bacterium]|nr:nitrilase-related carbon-nitrogen hydrolase [Planctomycetota bacterium]